MSEQSSAPAAPASAPSEIKSESSNQPNVEVQASQESQPAIQATTETELKQEIAEAVKEGASEKEIKQMIKEFTLKVNGKEFIRKLDLNDDESVRKELQLAAAGRQAMQESAELKKLYNSEIARLRKNPGAVIKELGLSEDDVMGLFADEIEQYLAKKSKPKEETEREDRQKEFEKLKEKADKLEKELQDRERSVALAQAEKALETDIITALDSNPDLPNTPEVIARVADAMLWAMNNNWQDVTAADVIPTVKAEIQRDFRNLASSLKSPAALKAMLGDDVLGKLREERLEQAKSVTNVNNLKSPVSKKTEEPEKPKKKVSLSEFMGGR